MAELRDICILLVEDDQYSRFILGQIFQSMGINHDQAGNGSHALEMVKEKQYDLILMDINMPVMDGYESTRRIRELPWYHDIHIIALTADISETVNKEMESGLFNSVIVKPINPEQFLLEMIEFAKNK
jgi:CheY-like chemotaxis protein